MQVRDVYRLVCFWFCLDLCRKLSEFLQERYFTLITPSLNFRTNFSVNCGANYVRNISAEVNVTHVTCQRDGKWSDFPSCICKPLSLCRLCEPRDSLSTKGGAFRKAWILFAKNWTFWRAYTIACIIPSVKQKYCREFLIAPYAFLLWISPR